MPADKPSSEQHPDDERIRRQIERLNRDPSSTAVDPEHAAQDQSEDLQTGRHAYTDNATYIQRDIETPSDRRFVETDEEGVMLQDPDWEPPEDWDYDPDDPDGASPWRTLNQANRDFKLVDGDSGPETAGIKQDQRDQDITNDLVAWGKRVGLTSTELERATDMIANVEGQWLTNLGHDAVILATLTVVANQGPPEYAGRHKILRPRRPCPDDADVPDGHGTFVKTEEAVDAFVELRDSLGVTPSTIRECRQHLE
jgi:hypothetical protein